MSTPSPAQRPEWDAVWLHVAEAVSARSLCTRSKVGAVVVTPANRVVAVGYNNPPAGFRHDDRLCTEWCPRADPPVTWTSTDQTPPHTLIHRSSGTYVQPPGGSLGGYAERGPLTDEDWVALGFERSEELDPRYADCPSLHAEANALSVCDRVQREAGTIYVTSAVCHACAKLIANSGLARVVVSASAAAAAHREPDRSYDLLRDCGLTVDVDLW